MLKIAVGILVIGLLLAGCSASVALDSGYWLVDVLGVVFIFLAAAIGFRLINRFLPNRRKRN